MSFRDLSKLLPIGPKSLRSNPQHLETNFCPRQTKYPAFIHVNKVAMKISWPLSAFC